MKTLLKTINIFIIISIFIGMFCIHDAIKKPSYRYLKDITVYIVVKDENQEPKWMGTGVIVKITNDFTYILTNRHVAPRIEQGNICVEDYLDYCKPATVLKNGIADDEDMSLIRVNGKVAFKRAVKGVRNAKITDRVFMAGNHGAKYNIYREGVVSGHHASHYFMQLPVRGGDSGSGVIDKNGYLVGLVFALELDRGYIFDLPVVSIPNHTMVVSMTSEKIKTFLKNEI